jgi:peptide deformylase
MISFEIKKFKDPVLRKRAELVLKGERGLKELVFKMVDIMVESDGIGLAAPQLGILKRIIVAKTGPDNKSDFLCLINPKILKKSKEKILIEEGCLSFPGIFLDINRPIEIEIESENIEGKKINLTAKGVLSRVLQHELDHLDGVLFFNRLVLWKRWKFKFKNLWALFIF